MTREHEANNRKKIVKRPNWGLYLIVYVLFYPLLKVLFRLKVNRDDYHPPKGPFLVVSNHASFMDFLIVMLALYPRRLNAVAAQKFFLYRPLDKLLPLMGVIPKNLFDPDIRAIKRIMKVIKQGGRILLFPEGRCSTDGVYSGIHKSAGKLVKNLGVPVISCHIEGAYTCMPFWRKGIRLGRVRMTIADLFSQEDTGALSVDELNSAIDARLSGLDAKPSPKQLRTFGARRLAEGLHNILYLCPGCGGEFTLETRGNTIRCTACGIAAEIDRAAKITAEQSGTPPLIGRGRDLVLAGEPKTPRCLVPGSVHEWFTAQARHASRLLSEDMAPIIEPVTVRTPAAAGGGMVRSGSGMLRLDPGGWHYDGELSGSRVNLFFPIDTVPAIPFDPDNNFQIYAHGSFYMFTPEDAQKCVKYAILGECAYRRFAARPQMTGAQEP